jgi:transketolase
MNMRKIFPKIMNDLAQKDDKLVVLIGDVGHGGLLQFQKQYPDRFYNLGIAEQSMVGIAAGLALGGMHPVCFTIAPFLIERAFEQIKIDLCYQKLDVALVSVGASFDYANLGCTHHCYEDISVLRTLPNIDIFVPGNAKEFEYLFNKTWQNGKSKYFKLSEDSVFEDMICEPYCFYEYRCGKEKLVITSGSISKNIIRIEKDIGVIYLSTLSNLFRIQEEKLLNIMKKYDKIITVEENSIVGGLGDMIFDLCSKNSYNIPIKKIGIPHIFLENYGTADEHRKKLGLTYEDLRQQINEF